MRGAGWPGDVEVYVFASHRRESDAQNVCHIVLKARVEDKVRCFRVWKITDVDIPSINDAPEICEFLAVPLSGPDSHV